MNIRYYLIRIYIFNSNLSILLKIINIIINNINIPYITEWRTFLI
jgi:hypothetical protein